MSVAYQHFEASLSCHVHSNLLFLTTLQFEALSSSEPTRQRILEVFTLKKILLSLYLTRTTLRRRGERRQINAFLLAALEGRVQGVTFLPTYTWAKFVCVLWLAFHAGPRACLDVLDRNIFWWRNSETYFLLLTFTVLWIWIFRRFSTVENVCLSLRPSVRPSFWKNSAPIGRTSMKSDIWVFF
jgi:hypothetical protein